MQVFADEHGLFGGSRQVIQKTIFRTKAFIENSTFRNRFNQFTRGRVKFINEKQQKGISDLKNVSDKPIMVFIKELLANPRNIGAALPSSKKLASNMAKFIPADPAGYVVELGAGTGVVTSALLKNGVCPTKLIIVEQSKPLADLLRAKFPNSIVIQGDAATLNTLLAAEIDFELHHVKSIVSSLPLRSLPRNKVTHIKAQIENTIGKNGRLIQFTYDFIRPTKAESLGAFRKSHSKIIWGNVPPARIEIFKKNRMNMH